MATTLTPIALLCATKVGGQKRLARGDPSCAARSSSIPSNQPVVKTLMDLILQPRPPLTAVSKESPEPLPALLSKKCLKQSRNSLRSLKTVNFETSETVSRLFRTLFGAGDSLETLSGFLARRARETPVRGGRGCKPYLVELGPLWVYRLPIMFSECRRPDTMRPKMTTQKNSETILLCDRCACNWQINSQTINECNWRVHRKYL